MSPVEINCYGKLNSSMHPFSHFMELNGRCTSLKIFGSALKIQIQLHFRVNPVQVLSIPAGVPRHIFPFPREPRNISSHPCGIPADSAGFPWSPSPCRSLVSGPALLQLSLWTFSDQTWFMCSICSVVFVYFIWTIFHRYKKYYY